MSRSQILVTAGVMLSLFMASMEATVVATAMPTIVSQLGGLAAYSWVFSVYMLTSTLQFSRSIGGTLGVSIMGAALTLRLFSGLREAGLDPAGISVDSLLDPVARATSNMNVEGVLRTALAAAIQNVFVIALVTAALGLAATAFAPTQELGSSSARPTGPKAQANPFA